MTPPLRPARLLRQASPLLISVLAAALLHALALSFVQLRSSREAISAAAGRTAPVGRDDTPELLRLSRRLAQGSALPPLILPPGDVLPPPPPELDRTLPAATPPAGTLSAAARRQLRGPSRRAPRAAGSRRRPAAAGAGPAATASPEAAAPQETPQALIEQARRQLGSGAEAGGTRGEGPLPAAWQQLWEAAATGAEPPAALAALGGGVELRRLPQAVLVGDRLLLLWRDGAALWLVRVGREGRGAE